MFFEIRWICVLFLYSDSLLLICVFMFRPCTNARIILLSIRNTIDSMHSILLLFIRVRLLTGEKETREENVWLPLKVCACACVSVWQRGKLSPTVYKSVLSVNCIVFHTQPHNGRLKHDFKLIDTTWSQTWINSPIQQIAWNESQRTKAMEVMRDDDDTKTNTHTHTNTHHIWSAKQSNGRLVLFLLRPIVFVSGYDIFTRNFHNTNKSATGWKIDSNRSTGSCSHPK